MSSTPEIVSIVGARPQFVKLAPVSRALDEAGISTHRLIHTGQHYDEKMSAVFFDELELPHPDLDLEVGSAAHGAQTGAMLSKLEAVLETWNPQAVLVYGDTNSTLAGTLAATKIHIPVAHIEAGLRSFDRSMPEEINRLVADHCSDRLYAPTPAAMKNLSDENIADRSVQTGDVMRDAVLHNLGLANEKSRILERLGLDSGSYGLLTIHRPINTTSKILAQLLATIEDLGALSFRFVFPVHPRARGLLKEMNYQETPGIHLVEPAAYLDMLRLLQGASVVITDSGGVQKEAAFLKTPCITLREETEWTETVDMGVNRLVGNRASAIHGAFDDFVEGPSPFDSTVQSELNRQYGTGEAAKVITEDLLDWIDVKSQSD